MTKTKVLKVNREELEQQQTQLRNTDFHPQSKPHFDWIQSHQRLARQEVTPIMHCCRTSARKRFKREKLTGAEEEEDEESELLET